MYILDTDHISIMDRGGLAAQPLLARLIRVKPNQVFTTIITYEEQMRGWLSYTAKTSSIAEQIAAYQKLERHIANYRKILVLSFDDKVGEVFQNLRKQYPRLGTMDLKIAAIAIANQSMLLTRNTKDFSQIRNLSIEDWTT
ncbi:MAG: type II toxin-antitoxin system VapC family toxin [Acaryochloridaceae cyanobacterium RU_4_10]|nr:type II toxin-antitoxin system VapC family toxin [Acaryochloridaceae cyanobacterium RU_4_10]